MSEEADDLEAVGEAWSKRRVGLVLGALLLSIVPARVSAFLHWNTDTSQLRTDQE